MIIKEIEFRIRRYDPEKDTVYYDYILVLMACPLVLLMRKSKY